MDVKASEEHFDRKRLQFKGTDATEHQTTNPPLKSSQHERISILRIKMI